MYLHRRTERAPRRLGKIVLVKGLQEQCMMYQLTARQ